MKFKENRGSFAESMQTVREYNSIEELKSHLNTLVSQFDNEIAEIKFKYAGLDRRNGWDTYYVLQRFVNQQEFYVAGMSDGVFEIVPEPKKESKYKGIDSRDISCCCENNNCCEGGISFEENYLNFHFLEFIVGTEILNQRTKKMLLNDKTRNELIEKLKELEF